MSFFCFLLLGGHTKIFPFFFKDFKSLRNGILDRPPLVATVQALSLLAIYAGMSGGENSIESTWALMGLAGKLAQSVSLFSFHHFEGICLIGFSFS